MIRTSLLRNRGLLAVFAVSAMLALPGISLAGPGSMAGTYLAEFSLGNQTLIGMSTIHNNGTWTMSDQTDFGGIPGFDSVQSPWRGIWEFSGHNQITFKGISLNFDKDSGFPTGASRMEAVVTMDPGFLTGSGTASQRFYALGEDPLDPEAGIPAPPPLNALPATLRKMLE